MATTPPTANQKEASNAIAQLTRERAELMTSIERKQARVVIIDAQLAALQPLAPVQPQQGN